MTDKPLTNFFPGTLNTELLRKGSPNPPEEQRLYSCRVLSSGGKSNYRVEHKRKFTKEMLLQKWQ